MAVVNDVNSATIVMDSSFLEARNSLLIIITVISYSIWHYQLYYYLYKDNGNN